MYRASILTNNRLLATVYEFILFGFAVYKSIVSSTARVKLNRRQSLMAVLLQENIIYFLLCVSLCLIFGLLLNPFHRIGFLLIVNNLMAVVCRSFHWQTFTEPYSHWPYRKGVHRYSLVRVWVRDFRQLYWEKLNGRQIAHSMHQ